MNVHLVYGWRTLTVPKKCMVLGEVRFGGRDSGGDWSALHTCFATLNLSSHYPEELYVRMQMDFTLPTPYYKSCVSPHVNRVGQCPDNSLWVGLTMVCRCFVLYSAYADMSNYIVAFISMQKQLEWDSQNDPLKNKSLYGFVQFIVLICENTSWTTYNDVLFVCLSSINYI